MSNLVLQFTNNFFNESAPLMQYYLQIDKVANYFMDFHLLKSCINKVISFAKLSDTKTTTANEEIFIGQLKEEMRRLLTFVNEHGSDIDLLILQEELYSIDDYKIEEVLQSAWLDSKNKINAFVNAKYIEHVVNRQLAITMEQYKTELLKVVYTNRAKQNILLENRLNKLAYRMTNTNKRLDNIRIITKYMAQLQEIKNASSNGELYITDVKANSFKKEHFYPQIPFYNWIDRKK